MSDKIVSQTKQSKIVKYKLEELCVALKRSGLSYQQIADDLNASGKVPEGDNIDKFVVVRFLEKMPEVAKEIVASDKKRMVQVVSANLDIIHETGVLYIKTKNLLEALEEKAAERDNCINPFQYRALCSEMRELLKQMTDIQRDFHDYNNIKKFLEIVIQVLQEECPDILPVIVQRLRLTKGTGWFGDIISRGN